MPEEKNILSKSFKHKHRHNISNKPPKLSNSELIDVNNLADLRESRYRRVSYRNLVSFYFSILIHSCHETSCMEVYKTKDKKGHLKCLR